MPDEKKLIIDEDWKSQVEAEKRNAQDAPASDADKREAESPRQETSGPHDMRMPPASFEMLLTSLATEALMALGQMPHPLTGKIEAHRDHAKYLIDTIEVLREKTKGNLDSDEAEMVETLLHQLHMAFIATAP
jgi:Domain of unknown function (DUF1844)